MSRILAEATRATAVIPAGNSPLPARRPSGPSRSRSWSGGAFGQSAAVDPAGGFEPKLGFLSTGKMVIAYRQLPSYDLVLAVQQ